MKIFNHDLKLFSKIFLISSVPVTSWSAPKPNIFFPKVETFIFLCLGLFLFGIGESILVISQNGVTPWTVLAEGIANKVNIGIGLSTFIISCIVLIFWLPLKLKPGLGTIMNIIIIALTMGVTIPFLYFLSEIFNPIFLSFFGTFLVGFGSGIYLTANLGPGPRDGLMTGLQRVTQYPIAWVRVFIEVSVVGVGWILGGTVGVGTLLFAFGIGPAVALGLHLVAKINK